MFDLDTIHKRDQKEVDRELRRQQVRVRRMTTNPRRLLNALETGLEIDLAVGRYTEVMKVCEQLTDIGLRCAPKAYARIVKEMKKS